MERVRLTERQSDEIVPQEERRLRAPAAPSPEQRSQRIQRGRETNLMHALIEELAHEANPLKRNEISGRIASLWRKHHPGSGSEDGELSA